MNLSSGCARTDPDYREWYTICHWNRRKNDIYFIIKSMLVYSLYLVKELLYYSACMNIISLGPTCELFHPIVYLSSMFDIDQGISCP